MAVDTKAVKNRIRSVKNTKKITKAMQMIAAVKMRKAVEAAINTRLYARLAKTMMTNIGKSLETEHPLAQKRDVKNSLLIVITSNRGLCGNYNSFVTKKAQQILSANTDRKFSVIAIGKKAAAFAKRNNLELIALYEKLGENVNFNDILPISKMAMDEFSSKNYDEVLVVYTDYISGLIQTVNILNLLPLSAEAIEEIIEKTGGLEDKEEGENFEEDNDILYEPDKQELLDYLIPMLVEVQVYQSLLESSASEHSSRMIAMKNATEAAGEMIDILTLEYNKGRQAAITKEITEIVSGANALGM